MDNDMTHSPHSAPFFHLALAPHVCPGTPGSLAPNCVPWGQQLTGVKAVLVVSPHWQTRECSLDHTTAETVHDFALPGRLYQLQYPAPAARSWPLMRLRLLRKRLAVTSR